MSRPEGRDLARILARKAEGDAKATRRLAPDSEIDDEAVGFHAQQGIEKWLKVVMAFHGLEQVRIQILVACWSFFCPRPAELNRTPEIDFARKPGDAFGARPVSGFEFGSAERPECKLIVL